jgi:hypothetical protein
LYRPNTKDEGKILIPEKINVEQQMQRSEVVFLKLHSSLALLTLFRKSEAGKLPEIKKTCFRPDGKYAKRQETEVDWAGSITPAARMAEC